VSNDGFGISLVKSSASTAREFQQLRKLEDNIKIDIKELCCKDVNWMGLTAGSDAEHSGNRIQYSVGCITYITPFQGLLGVGELQKTGHRQNI
jgi:hypothetical protein